MANKYFYRDWELELIRILVWLLSHVEENKKKDVESSLVKFIEERLHPSLRNASENQARSLIASLQKQNYKEALSPENVMSSFSKLRKSIVAYFILRDSRLNQFTPSSTSKEKVKKFNLETDFERLIKDILGTGLVSNLDLPSDDIKRIESSLWKGFGLVPRINSPLKRHSVAVLIGLAGFVLVTLIKGTSIFDFPIALTLPVSWFTGLFLMHFGRKVFSKGNASEAGLELKKLKIATHALVLGDQKLECSNCRYTDFDKDPIKSIVLSSTWKFVNKDGTADKRRKDNFKIVELNETYRCNTCNHNTEITYSKSTNEGS